MAESEKRAVGAREEKQDTKGNVTRTIAWAALEFSKKIVTFIMGVFAVHALISLGAILADPEAYTTPMKALMDSCMPIYLCGVVGYDAKAGMENALKITTQAKKFTADDGAIG